MSAPVQQRPLLTTVCLIIPCFNEANRLRLDAFADLPPSLQVVFVDDGSTDGTADLIRSLVSRRLHLFCLERNVGKAEAVRQGVLRAQASGLLDGVEWVGYWDADLATPLTDLPEFLAFGELAHGRVDAIIGSRVQRLGSEIVRSHMRHLVGRGFTTLARILLRVGCYDSQCGAKIFRTALTSAVFREPFTTRWLFDLEILLRLRNANIIEFPLPRWKDIPGSKVRVLRLAVPTIRGLLQIRRRYISPRERL